MKARFFLLLACVGLVVCLSTVALPVWAVDAMPPAATETPTPELGWEGRIVSNTPWATNGSGSILRVHVVGQTGVNIEVTEYDQTITGLSGSKTEYGPYAAEFAPLSRGTYLVSLPTLNVSQEIWADGYNLVVVEFTRTRQLNATPTPGGPAPTSTPTPGAEWEGRLLGVTDKFMAGSLLWVKVSGHKGHKVTVSTVGGFSATAITGVKEELGEDVAEFAALSKGTYTITPWGMNSSLTLDLDGSNIWSVEFSPVSTERSISLVLSLPTSTPMPATPTPTVVTQRVIGSGARPRGLVSATITPTQTPPPLYAWQGQVVRRESAPQGAYLGSIAVQVVSMKGITVQLTSGPWKAEGLTGSKPEYGDYSVEFGGLQGGTYYASVPALGIKPVAAEIAGGGFALVKFSYEPLPAGSSIPTPIPGNWMGGVTSNTSGKETVGGVWSNIIVKAGSLKGLKVLLQSDGYEADCFTGTKPEYGEGACEFGGLGAGTYRVTPEGLGPSVTVVMDGRGAAVVEFWAR